MTRKSFFVRIEMLLISFLFIGLFFSGNSAYAKTFTNVEIGDFTYDLDEDTQIATVTKYSPSWWSRTFGEASKSDSVVIPESVEYKKKNYSVETIGKKFFESTSYMRDLKKKSVSGESIKVIGNSAFGYSDSWTQNVHLESVYFPNATEIGENSFRNCVNLKDVYIPKARTIGYSAFSNCFQLPYMYLPNVGSIGGYAFSGCSSLTAIYIPNVFDVGYSAFEYCSDLKSISLPNVTEIGGYLFYSCSNLTDVNLPRATKIGNGAFEYCRNLTNISLPNVTEIGGYEFENCTSLTEVNLPRVTKIGDEAFYGCSSLKNISLPNVAKISDHAFRNCKNLTNVDLLNATEIGYAVFRNCSSLTDINLPNATKISAWAFENCRKLTNISIPNATEIGQLAFNNCKNLTDISLPNATNFGTAPFADSELTNISLPKVESINFEVFLNCAYLKLIEVPNLKSCEKDVFRRIPVLGIPRGVTLKVPVSMRNYGLENLPDSDNVNIVYIGLGKKVINSGIVNYVDEEGKTSAEITDKKIIWLKETSNGTSAWYGIDNSQGTFKIGSTFWVKWLHPDINKEEFEIYYNKLDDELKKKVENDNLWIFLTGVTDPDGNEYTNLDKPIDYYVQIGEDWDKNDVNAVFISNTTDEALPVSYESLKWPDGTYEFAVLEMKHFSPYAVFDKTNDIVASNKSTDTLVGAEKSSASVITGENLQILNLMFMLYASWLAVAYLNRKSRI